MPRAAIVAVIKNEENSIAEWILFHFAVGFDCVIIFDNASSDRTTEIAFEVGKTRDVRVIPWDFSESRYQVNAYDFAVGRFRRDFDWIFFIDSDEFFVPAGNLPDLLGAFGDVFSAVALPWAFFGSSGHDQAPPGLIIENFVFRAPENFIPNKIIKSAVRPNQVIKCLTPHLFETINGYCDLSGKKTLWERPGLLGNPPDFSLGKLNHYFVKSKEDFKSKLSRGYHNHVRTWDEFAQYDCNQVFDPSAIRFSPTIKKELASFERDVGVVNTQRSHLISRGKRYTQSSISKFSLFASVTEDAAGAADGILDGRHHFHTDLEDGPWWCADLGEVFSITGVRVFNRLDHPEMAKRASDLVVEMSIDGQSFLEIFKHTGRGAFGGVDGEPLWVKMNPPFFARFVRIRLLRREYLHLNQVEVFGFMPPDFVRMAIVPEQLERQTYEEV